jgi:PAS domain S-box-containing protein
MNPDAASPAIDPTDEVSTLIETLHACEQRLAVLTAGEVDAVSNRAGRTILLKHAQERLRDADVVRQAAILEALPAHVALIDKRGCIVSVNQAWCRLARDNVLQGPGYGVGLNYLDACERATGSDAAIARAAALGIRAVLAADVKSYSIEYACHTAQDERWFQLTVSPLSDQPPSGAVVMHTDVTARTRAQRSMQRSSELLSAVAAGTPDMVFVKDREGRYLLCNQAFARFVGRSIDEMIGQDNAALFGAAGSSELAQTDRLVMQSNDSVSTEDVLTGVAGTRTFQVTKAPYRDAFGEVIGVIGISRDISERKRAEQDLRESQALLSMSGRLAQVGAWYVDLPPRNIVWSPVLTAIHEVPDGFSPTIEEAFGYYAAEHRSVARLALNECMAHGTPFDVEHEIVTAKGKRVWVRAIGQAVRGADGEIRRVEGALQDISDLRRAEQETRLLAYRLANTLDSITDGFLTLDRDWRFTFVNNEALRMLDRTRENLIGRNMWEEFPAALGTDFERGYRDAMVADGGTNFEAFYQPWNAWIAVHCYPSETGLSVYFRDVTQRRKDQDALRVLNADLEARVAERTTELNLAREGAEQANRAKSAFLAAMSHEIRTPMNGVVGMIDVLEQSSLKTSQADIVKTVRESAYALLSIVDDVLDFSKIEAGHFQIDRDPMAIERVVERVHDTLDHLAASKGVALQVSLDPAIPARVLGDPARLRQVLLNLVGNAIKFSSADGPVGRVEVTARLVARDGAIASVEFAITDNGIGMDPPTLSRLFTPFTQADDSTTKRFGGTGLGLSISSRLAGLMGGAIKVSSEPGRGSQFTMRLPFEVMDGEPVSTTFGDDEFREDTGWGDLESAPMPLGAPGAASIGRLILVAEDNEINQKVIRKQLALLGYTTEIVSSGREALERSRHGSFAMLLTDLHMPAMDGYELARAVRKDEVDGARMPVIALTANALKGEAKRCKDVGMDDYMTKPVQLADLHAMLVKWMPASAKPRALRKPRVGDDRVQAKLNHDVRGSTNAGSPPADLGVLAALVGNDPKILGEMLEAFLRSAARSGEAIGQGVASGHTKAVADAAHTLRSGARSIGAKRLGILCEDLERAAQAGRSAELADLLVRFQAELGSLQAYLKGRQLASGIAHTAPFATR